MTDELNPDGTPPGSSEQSGPSGAELDQLLAEAADLAAEVSAEVGTLPARSNSSNIPIDSLEPDSSDIEEKLNELDQILERTADEVGVGAPDADERDSPPGTIDALAVPDFMSEFMDVEKPAAPAYAEPAVMPFTPPTYAAPDPKPIERAVPAVIPDFMAEFTQPDAGATAAAPGDPHALTPAGASRNPPKLGVVGSPVKPIAVPDEPELVGAKYESPMAPPQPAAPVAPVAPPVVSTGGPPVTIQSVPAAPSSGSAAPIEAGESAPPNQAGGMAIVVAALLVRMMEEVDRPFARLGQGPRKAIGLLALVMFAASLVVFTAAWL